MRYFGLIGKPLEHSFSKSFFDAYFSKHAIKDATFINFEIDDVSELSALVESYPTNRCCKLYTYSKQTT